MKIVVLICWVGGLSQSPPTWSPFYFPPITRRPTSLPFTTNIPYMTTTTQPSAAFYMTTATAQPTLFSKHSSTLTPTALILLTEKSSVEIFFNQYFLYVILSGVGTIVLILCFVYCMYNMRIENDDDEEDPIDLGSIETVLKRQTIVRQNGHRNLNHIIMEKKEKNNTFKTFDPDSLHLAWLNEEYEEDVPVPVPTSKKSVLQKIVDHTLTNTFTSSKKKNTPSHKTTYFSLSSKDFIPPPPTRPPPPPPPPPTKRNKVLPY